MAKGVSTQRSGDPQAADGRVTPARRESASARAYDFVRDQIINGGYPAGELITEMQVAEAIGMSRTPVREAFTVLGREGWLRVFRNRGALVVPVSYAEVDDVFELRRMIETWVMERLMSRPISEEVRDELRAAVAEQRAALEEGLLTFRAAGQRLHTILVDAVGNALLADVYANVQARQMRMGPSPVEPPADPGWGARLVAEHESLVDAIVAGDRELALRLTDEHITSQAALERRPRR